MIYNKNLRVHQCTFCTLVNNNIEFPSCCTGKYLPTNGNICLANLLNCDVMNADGTCKKCKSSFYVSNGNCCSNGTMWSGSQCVIIPVDRKC